MFFACFFDDVGLIGDTGAFHYAVGSEYARFVVRAFFVVDVLAG